MNEKIHLPQDNWMIVERPGYLGKRRPTKEHEWNERYGKDNWRINWRKPDKSEITYLEIIEEYIQGYEAFLLENIDFLNHITQKYSFIYDIDPNISKENAFDPTALFGKEGVANQFHNVALNIAVEERIGIKFKGAEPGQVRGMKEEYIGPWTIEALLQPGSIPCLHPELICKTEKETWWIKHDSIEALYQNNKVLEVKGK